METTWKPHEKHGELTERSDLPDSVFAFPKQRKEPMTDASHVRNAIARFDQTIGVSDEDRKLAFANTRRQPSITASTCPNRTGPNWASIRAPTEPLKTAASPRRRRQPRARKGNAASNTNDGDVRTA
jgi:uncharacterized protein DUF6582